MNLVITFLICLYNMLDFRLPPLRASNLRSPEMLRSVDEQPLTDVSGQPVPLSNGRQYKENAGNVSVRSYIRNGVGGDWFSGNVTRANRVSGERPWNTKSPPGARQWNVKKKKGRGIERRRKKNKKYEGERQNRKKRKQRDSEPTRITPFSENRSQPTPFPIQLGQIDCLETSVTNQQSTPHNIPEEQRSTVNVFTGAVYSKLGMSKLQI